MIHAAAATELDQSHVPNGPFSAHCLTPGPSLKSCHLRWAKSRCRTNNAGQLLRSNSNSEATSTPVSNSHPQPIFNHCEKLGVNLGGSKTNVAENHKNAFPWTHHGLYLSGTLYPHMDTMKRRYEMICLLDTDGEHTEGAYCLINLSHNPGRFVLLRYRDPDQNSPCSLRLPVSFPCWARRSSWETWR